MFDFVQGSTNVGGPRGKNFEDVLYSPKTYCTVRNPALGLQWIFNKAIYLSRNIHETTNIIFTKTLILLTLVTSTPTPKRVSKTQ